MARNVYMEELNESTYFPDEYAGIADNFFQAYRIESWTVCPGEKMRIKKNGRVLVCRFCGKTSEEVKFGYAHVLSELLGNRYLVSDFECDSCNKLFGGNEDQLSKFLGMARTVLFAKGKEKVPTFKSDGIRMETSVDNHGDSWLHISRDSASGNISYDLVTGSVKVTGIKQSYVPQAVYKALVKMALSCVSDQVVQDYRLGLDYIRGVGYEEAGGVFARTVIRYTFPPAFRYERPTVYIFKKRDPDALLFNRVFLLFALNYIYILPIPFDLEDMKHGGGSLELVPPPPIFTNKYHFPTSAILREIMDLSSLEIVKNDVDAIYISGRPGEKPFGFVYDNGTSGVSDRVFDVNDIERISIKRVLL